jgi:serine protease inhibitor
MKTFDENATDVNAEFYEANGTKSKISMMYMKHKFAYTENKDLQVQVAHLPYKSQNSHLQFVFTIILPNRDVQLDEVERKLALKPALLQQLMDHSSTTSQELLLYLPKFKMETTFNLNDVLIRLGMRDAFSDTEANFRGMVSRDTDPAGLYISKVRWSMSTSVIANSTVYLFFLPINYSR